MTNTIETIQADGITMMLFTDKDLDIPQKGQIFRTAAGECLKCIKMESEHIADDGLSIGFGRDSGTIFQAHCVPATPDQIVRFTAWEEENKPKPVDPNVFRARSGTFGTYKASRNGTKISIQPYADMVGGYGADTCAIYDTETDTLEFPKMAEFHRAEFEQGFRKWFTKTTG